MLSQLRILRLLSTSAQSHSDLFALWCGHQIQGLLHARRALHPSVTPPIPLDPAPFLCCIDFERIER